MIFVNTSLDVALQRNAERPRSVPESIVTKSWNDVQSNIGKFSQYFRQNFVVVDNNNATEDVFVKVFKQIKGLTEEEGQKLDRTTVGHATDGLGYHKKTQRILKKLLTNLFDCSILCI